MEQSLTELIQEYRDHKRVQCMEGSSGCQNLCKLVRAMGYRDAMNRQYGDLIKFFEDNPGAIEAVIDWIAEQDIQDWKECLESELPEKEYGNCRQCNYPLNADGYCTDPDCFHYEHLQNQSAI